MSQTMRKWSVFSAWALALAVAAPCFGTCKDDFPFSTYPMFTSDRSRVDLVSLVYASSEAQLGEGQRVAPELIAGQEAMMATSTIARAMRGGAPGMSRLCEEVAKRAVSREISMPAVAFVIEAVDVRAFVRGQDARLARRVYFVCPRMRLQQ